MAQRFRTDLVDEIVQGGIKFWRAVTATGSILLKDFKMERTNANTQEGSAFGAKEANAVHAFLNGLLEGTETVNKATNSTNASNAPDGFSIGSPEDPKKVAQLWITEDLKVSLYGDTTGFRIQLKKADGTFVHNLLISNIDGESTVDNATNAVNLNGQSSSYYAKQTDINSIKNGGIQVGNTAKLGGQLPSFYAKASQFQDIEKIRRYQYTTNPGGKDYFDVGRNGNEFIIPLHASNGIIITGMQYAGSSVRILMRDSASVNITFYYMIVYV